MKKIIQASLAAMTLALVFCFSACSSTTDEVPPEPQKPQFSESGYEYDLRLGGDLKLSLDCKGETLAAFYIGETALESTVYTYDNSIVTVDESYMLALSVGDYALKATTVGGDAEATLEVIRSEIPPEPQEPQFSESGYEYDLRLGGDLKLSLDCKGETLAAFYIGETAMESAVYTYDNSIVTVDEGYMLALSVGDHALKATTAGGDAEATLEVIRSEDPEEKKPVFGEERVDYDLNAHEDLSVPLDMRGGEIAEVKLDGEALDGESYSYADGVLVIRALYLFGLSAGDHELTVTGENGYASTVVEVTDDITAPAFAYEKYVYDLAIGGELDLKFSDGGGELAYLYIGENEFESGLFDLTDGVITVGEDTLDFLVIGEYELRAVATSGSASSRLYVINTVKTSFTDESVVDYDYAKTGSLAFDADFDNVTVVSLTRKCVHDAEPVLVDPSGYSYGGGKFVLGESVLDKLYGSAEFTVRLSNRDKYAFTVNTDVLFYTDYDVTTIHDAHNEPGIYNVLYNPAKTAALAEKDGGRVLRFSNGGDPALQQAAAFTIRNSLLENSLWYAVETPAGKYITVEFDYEASGITGSNRYDFTYVADGKGAVRQEIDISEGKKHARYTVSTDGLRVICVEINAHDGTSYLDVDNFRVTLIDNATLGGELPDYNTTTGGGLSIPFDNYGYAISEVKLNGETIEYTYENKTLTIAEAQMPTEIGSASLTVETKVFTAVYNFNIVTDDFKVTLTKTAYDYRYGDSSLTVEGSFGRRVTVSSLTKKCTHDVTAATVDPSLYTFDPATGLTLKEGILDKLYMTTAFVATMSGMEYSFTVTSNVLFYTDYDVTTIHDAHNEPGIYNVLYNPAKTAALAEKGGGRVLRFSNGGDPALQQAAAFTIRNSLLENSLWYAVETPAGKYITVEFDYEASGITGSNRYDFTYVADGKGAVRQEIDISEGKKHARYTVSTDGLRVICVEINAHDGTSYLDVDNFRVTLVDSAPSRSAPALNGAKTMSVRTGETVDGGAVKYRFSDESEARDFAFYSLTGDNMFISEGCLVSLPYAKEQKAILGRKFSGDIDVSVDVAPIAGDHMIDGGIYLNVKGTPEHRLDGINGLCLNVERATREKKYRLKLHSFNYGYLGALRDVELAYNGVSVHIRAVVISGTLYAYADGALAFTYPIPEYGGQYVGLRSFYAAQKFDNFTVVSASLSLDTSALDALVARFDDLEADAYLAEEYAALSSSVAAARDDISSQTVIDGNVEAIEEAFARLVVKRSRAELDALSEICGAVEQSRFTTRNAYLSMRSLIARAAVATDERIISELYGYMTFILENALEAQL